MASWGWIASEAIFTPGGRAAAGAPRRSRAETAPSAGFLMEFSPSLHAASTRDGGPGADRGVEWVRGPASERGPEAPRGGGSSGHEESAWPPGPLREWPA